MNHKKSILVVDDQPENLKVLGNMLRENGYVPTFAKSGVKALSAIKNKLPVLILLDVMMPGMSGFDVCKQLKREPILADIPVIFLTGKADQADIITGLELGAVDYVTKPFNYRELITRVNTHVELETAKEILGKKVEELEHAKVAIAKKIEELKQANATKDKFFSIIAHDLMTPFTALLAFSSMLTDKNVQLSAKQKDQFINNIMEASNSGYNLLKNLLDWSRSQTGRLKIKPALINLKYIVDNNVELVGDNAIAKNVNIFSHIDELTQVFADVHTFDTVIRNLLSNAVKFTPTNGKIEIFAKTQDSEVEISISDTGVGIKVADIDKLFRTDVSFSTLGTAKESGTGLGLTLCQEFVEKNGGTIGVESEEGKGSRFYVRLPATSPE
jgi:signal transduction histidine kinase